MNLIIDNSLIGLEVKNFLTHRKGKIVAVFVGGPNNELCFTVKTETAIFSGLAGEFGVVNDAPKSN